MGIPRYPDSDGPTTRPAKRGDETEAEFRQRELAWQTAQSGVGSGTGANVGIPTPWFGSVGVTGVRLGDFGVASTANLPPPTLAGASDAFDPDSPVRYRIDDPNFRDSPSFPVADPTDSHASPGLPAPQALMPISLNPARFGPVGSIMQGLREARDPTPEELERERVLAATGYDIAWGTPASPTGLRWSPTRYVYEPTLDRAGVPYRFPARDGMFLQPYPVEDSGVGLWSQRWVLVSTPLPNPAKPYQVLDRTQAPALGGEVGTTGDGVTRWENPLARPFVPKYGPPKREFKLKDYAWVGRDQLPVGCPYPYPAMPVPQADYASGRWLDADYVPSIPLPPPYDQTPWQCGVPKVPGKPHKGGGAPTQPMKMEGGPSGGSDPIGHQTWAESMVADVGMPPPGGNIFLAPVPTPDPPAPDGDATKKAPPPCHVLLVEVVDALTGLSPADQAVHLGVLARRAFYLRIPCRVDVIRVTSIDALICALADRNRSGYSKVDGISSDVPFPGKDPTGKISLSNDYLHVEIYAHGNVNGAKSGKEGNAQADALGLALAGIMSSGKGQQGHILLGWCDACSVTLDSRGERIGGLVASMSGHVVYGASNKIQFVSDPDSHLPMSEIGLRPFEEPFPLPIDFVEGMTEAEANKLTGSGWIVSDPVREISVSDPTNPTRSISILNDGSRRDDRKPKEVVRATEPGAANLPYAPWEVGAHVYPNEKGISLGGFAREQDPHARTPAELGGSIPSSWHGVGTSDEKRIGTGKAPHVDTLSVPVEPKPPGGEHPAARDIEKAARAKGKYEADLTVHQIRSAESDRIVKATTYLKSPAAHGCNGAKAGR